MSLKSLLDNGRLRFSYNTRNSNNKLLRILDCYVRLSGKCTKQFKTYFIILERMLNKFNLVHHAFEKYYGGL